MPRTLVVDCICGNSFYATEADLTKDLVGMHECNGVSTKEGKRIICRHLIAHIKLLKIMQLTRYWDANDTETERRAESTPL